MADSAPAERPATLAAQLDELESHLVSLEAAADPSQLFQADLFDRVNYQLGPVSYPDLTARFLPRLGLVLKKTAEAEATSQGWKGYPQPLVSLTIKLLRPVPFTDALGLCTPAYLITALGSPDENLNELALSILEKATASPPASSILAAVPGLLEALLSSWLLSPSVSVGQRGVVLLGDLLDVDCPRPQPVFTDDQKECLDIRLVARGPAQGHGAVWRRLFGAEEGLCWATLQKVEAELAGGDDDPKIRNQRTLAQDRLLRLLPRLAVLDISPLLVSAHQHAQYCHSLPAYLFNTSHVSHHSVPLTKAHPPADLNSTTRPPRPTPLPSRLRNSPHGRPTQRRARPPHLDRLYDEAHRQPPHSRRLHNPANTTGRRRARRIRRTRRGGAAPRARRRRPGPHRRAVGHARQPHMDTARRGGCHAGVAARSRAAGCCADRRV